MLETIFSLCGALAMIGWAALIFLPSNRFVVDTLTRTLIPGVIGAIYIAVMASSFRGFVISTYFRRARP